MPERTDLADFRARVRELQADLERAGTHPAAAASVAESIPDTVLVRASSGEEYEFSFSWLKQSLAKLGDADEKTRHEEVRRSRLALEQLEQRLAHYEEPQDSTAKAKLEAVLSKREFANVRGQTWAERMQEEVLRWILKLLERLAPGLSPFVGLSRILVIATIVLALVLLAFWIYRLLSRSSPAASFSLTADEHVPSAKSWRVWLAEAHAAASAGQWREAIRRCYWASISQLESSGAWRPDKARTPREYLALLAADRIEQEPLRELTRRFEMAWYAHAPVSQAEFSATLEMTERLGCR